MAGKKADSGGRGARIFAAGAVLLTLAFSVFGCAGPEKAGAEKESTETESAGGTEEDRDPVRIGITLDSFVVERWQRDRDVFVDEATGLDAKVNVQTANGDSAKQIRDIEYFINQGEDVIVIVAVDSENLAPAIAKAKEAGIRVIAYDRLIGNADVDLYISFDNEQVGRYMATALNDALPDGGNLIRVLGPATDRNVAQIITGFESQISDTIRTIGETTCPNWTPEYAAKYLNENPDLLADTQAILCCNDSLADEVITVLSENRLAGKIAVTGQDADLKACQHIIAGTQTMTVYKPIEKLARTAADEAVLLARGGSVNAHSTISDGRYEVPCIKIGTQEVDRNNIDEVIIDGGFHLRQDVYMEDPTEIESSSDPSEDATQAP
jgi:D-xylose transport system substrate-binding protein